jgi:hypothetical protein
MTPPEKLPFAPVLRSLLEEEGRALDHAAPEQLVDYRAGRLSPEKADLQERHLRGCQECADLLRDLAEFEEFTPAPAEALADREGQAAWQRLQERLPVSVPAAVAGPRSGPVPIAPPAQWRSEPTRGAYSRASRPIWRWSAALMAASLLGCVIGLSLWIVRLKARVQDFSQPTVNSAMLELHADAVRSLEIPAVPPGGDNIILFLDLPENSPSSNDFRADLYRVGGSQPVKRVGGLHRMADGERLNLQVPRSLFPGGSYRLDLFIEGAGAVPLASYPFTVSSP